METGTVREIGAKLGDVLERSDGGDVGQTFEVMDNCHLKVSYGDGNAYVISRGWYWDNCTFRIISRATPQPDLTAITTPFGLLDEATQEALRAHDGPYEVWTVTGEWVRTYRPGFCPADTYRVKPAPKVETVTQGTPDLTGPVRTVTRKEPVPGVYGRIAVLPNDYRETVKLKFADNDGEVDAEDAAHYLNAKQLRAAIATLTQIADALEDQA